MDNFEDIHFTLTGGRYTVLEARYRIAARAWLDGGMKGLRPRKPDFLDEFRDGPIRLPLRRQNKPAPHLANWSGTVYNGSTLNQPGKPAPAEPGPRRSTMAKAPATHTLTLTKMDQSASSAKAGECRYSLGDGGGVIYAKACLFPDGKFPETTFFGAVPGEILPRDQVKVSPRGGGGGRAVTVKESYTAEEVAELEAKAKKDQERLTKQMDRLKAARQRVVDAAAQGELPQTDSVDEVLNS